MSAERRLFIDCDGVLTDGRLHIASEFNFALATALVREKPFKSFHTRDVTAIRELRDAGWHVSIVSADDAPHGEHFARKVGAEFVYDRDKDDLEGPYVAVGDSVLDLEMLQRAERAFCPADAEPFIRYLPGVERLSTNGGGGVIAELARVLLA